jgi:hypothetical protein
LIFAAVQTELLAIRSLSHSTSSDSGATISNKAWVRRGDQGVFGPGLYFSDSPEAAGRKTGRGADPMITANVDLGRAPVA